VQALPTVKERIQLRAAQLRGGDRRAAEGEMTARVFGRGAAALAGSHMEDAGGLDGGRVDTSGGGAVTGKYRVGLRDAARQKEQHQLHSRHQAAAQQASTAATVREQQLQKAAELTMLSPRIRQLDEALASDRPESLLPSGLLREQVAAYDADSRARSDRADRKKMKKLRRRADREQARASVSPVAKGSRGISTD